MDGRNLCVTGANGFIGSALVDHLAQNGWRVRAAVRRLGRPFAPLVDVVQGLELVAGSDWRPALEGTDVLVHAAARVHVLRNRSADALAQHRAVNVAGTMNLARQAATAGVRRFVFLSTVGVNGIQTLDRPFAALDPPAPRSPYAVSKCEAEMELLAMAGESKMEIVIVRSPLVYGPGAPGNLRTLTACLRRRVPLPLAGVDNLRSFLGLGNLLDLLRVCMVHPGAVNQVFMAADGMDVSTPNFLRRYGAALGCPAILFPMPMAILRVGASLLGRPELAIQLCGSLQIDMQATVDRLNWRPPYTLDQGLARAAASAAIGP